MARINKYQYLFVVQEYTSYGWEDLCASETRKEARDDIKSYRVNAPGAYRMIRRRELNVA